MVDCDRKGEREGGEGEKVYCEREVKLDNGVVMPRLGMGTYRLRDPTELNLILKAALSSGYKLLDTAQVYRNEAQLGTYLKGRWEDKHDPLKREDVFLVTKLAPRNQGYKEGYQAILESLKALQTDYIDLFLFLIHWPGTQGVKREDTTTNSAKRKGSWQAIERAYQEGKLRSIGVSNYTIPHLEELLSHCQIKPHVLQVELHPFYPQPELRSYCQLHNIKVMAYSSFGEGSLLNPHNEAHLKLKTHFESHLLDALNPFALPRHLLHWGLVNDAIVIPKSSSPSRIAANIATLDVPIDQKVQSCLDSLLTHHPPQKFCWDPTTIG